jgi:hypothetical protein
MPYPLPHAIKVNECSDSYCDRFIFRGPPPAYQTGAAEDGTGSCSRDARALSLVLTLALPCERNYM